MQENDPKIAELELRLESLVRTQIDFQVEVTAIRNELSRLRNASRAATQTPTTPSEPRPKPSIRAPEPEHRGEEQYAPREQPSPSFGYASGEKRRETQEAEASTPGYFSAYADSAKADLEKFIGENLISKIGIIVLILGVGIGAKYAIDNDLISPATRIIFGYVFGLGLLGFALRLKPKYHHFSAVLLSGGMAILYFITYFAYAVYGLIPQPAAFPVMVLLTVFTVGAAILYNLQIIAHIGLVGAYAVPFLLSTDSGNFAALFGYMGVINLGVLALSVRKYWKWLFYTASVFTWIIFLAWFGTRYSPENHLYLALGYLALFFGIFYAAKVVHGVVHAETEHAENIAAIVITTIIFFGFLFGISDFEGSSLQYTALFTYLAVASLAILIASYRYYGRVLVLVAYPFTWLIFARWFIDRYPAGEHFILAAVCASVFFTVFYVTTLIYRLKTDDIELPITAGTLLTNSFIFYGFGYAILDSREYLQWSLGLFTVGHAAFHSVVAQIVGRVKPAAEDIVQVLAVLIVTFVTIAVPVQFDGNFVTMIWSVEAVALFYFGRVRGIRFFEYFAYPLMMLACLSMLGDWYAVYIERFSRLVESAPRPFIDGGFITGLVFVAAFTALYLINRDERKGAAIDQKLVKPLGYLFGAICLGALYNVVRMEIGNFFHFLSLSTGPHPELSNLNAITQVDYTMLFLCVLGLVNLWRVRSSALGVVNVALSGLALFVFVTAGLYILYVLRIQYLTGEFLTIFGIPAWGIWVRPITYLLAAALLSMMWRYSRSEVFDVWASRDLRSLVFDAILYPVTLIAASCELMNLAAHFGIENAGKYGLSILWGVFALMLIVIGIARGRKHLRVAAIGLLAFTLVKLFFYDITDLGTIQKTLLFVALGILLLVISFLYNKYKNIIFGNEIDLEE